MSRDHAQVAKLYRESKQAQDRSSSEKRVLQRALRIGTILQIARHRHKFALAQIRARNLAAMESLNARYDKLHAKG